MNVATKNMEMPGILHINWYLSLDIEKDKKLLHTSTKIKVQEMFDTDM